MKKLILVLIILMIIILPAFSTYARDKDDFGFIIEDIENTCLNRTLKINKNPDDEKVKNYGTLELNKMNLLLIKELMKKNEELEKRIKELERKR